MGNELTQGEDGCEDMQPGCSVNTEAEIRLMWASAGLVIRTWDFHCRGPGMIPL